MESKCMKFSINKDLDVHSNSFDAFIAYMEHSNNFQIIKNHESRFVYANKTMIYYSKLPKEFNIEGLLDSECPDLQSKFEDVIQANDKNVMENKKQFQYLTRLFTEVRIKQYNHSFLK